MKPRTLLLAVAPLAMVLLLGCRSDPAAVPPSEEGEGKEPTKGSDALRPPLDTLVVFR